MIDQFGFEGNDEARQNLLESVLKMSAGRDMDNLEQWRDENLLQMMTHLKM